MIVAFDDGCSAVPEPPAKPQQPATPGPASGLAHGAHAAQKPDSVSKHDEGFLAAAQAWVTSEWGTVAGAAHGLISAPGVVSKAYLKAARANAALRESVESTLGNQSPALRQGEIDRFGKLASGSSSDGQALYTKLNDANRIPRLVEKAEAPLDRGLSAAGRFVGSKLDAAVDAAPSVLRAPLRRVAGGLKSAVAGAYHDVKGSVDAKIRTLDPELERAGHNLGDRFLAAERADARQAGGVVRTASRVIGTTVGDLSRSSVLTSMLDKASFLRDTPLVGLALAGAGSAVDAKEVGVPDAVVANAGSTFIGTAAGGAATDALAGLAGGSLESAALGVATVTGPAGWAVAGGVLAGAAIGYGAYEAIKSQAGQDVVNGIVHGNGKQIVKGVKEAGADVVHVGQHVEHAAVDAGKSIGHFVSSLF
jgi:hypothetical protein